MTVTITNFVLTMIAGNYDCNNHTISVTRKIVVITGNYDCNNHKVSVTRKIVVIAPVLVMMTKAITKRILQK